MYTAQKLSMRLIFVYTITDFEFFMLISWYKTKEEMMKKIIIGAVLSYSLAIAGGDIAPIEPIEEAPVAESTWKHSLSIYGWLPTIDGTFRFNIPGEPGQPDEEVESSVLDNLDMFLMGTYEARKDKWSFLADMIYLNMSDSQEVHPTNPIIDTIASEQELTAWLVSVYGGYNIVNTDKVTLDVIAGIRYLTLDLDVALAINNSDLSVSPSIDIYDAVMGLRGTYNINENWYIPYGFEIGGGDSDLTWQASTSLGYRYGWGDVFVTYRYIHYDIGNGLFEEMDLYGPKAGVTFHF